MYSRSSEIVLKGLAENVAKLYDAIRDVIFELKEAIATSKIAIWKWASASNIYNSLPLRVSCAIETEHEVKYHQTFFWRLFFLLKSKVSLKKFTKKKLCIMSKNRTKIIFCFDYLLHFNHAIKDVALNSIKFLLQFVEIVELSNWDKLLNYLIGTP